MKMDDTLVADVQRLLKDHAEFQDPYPLLTRARDACAAVPADPFYFVTRYQDVIEGYREQELSRQAAAAFECTTNSLANDDPILNEARLAWTSMLINRDEPDHKRIRRILESAFKPTQVAKWQGLMEEITGELIASVSDKPSFDLRTELAYPLPERIICALMKVPHEDHALWGAWTEAIVAAGRTNTPSPETVAAVDDAQRNFFLYFKDLVAARRHDLGEDLVSLLIRAEDEGDRLNELELLGALQMLIQAGHETTANLITNGMYTLLKHPEQYELLRQDPSLVGSAVEEMLRFASPSHWSLPRIALSDVQVGDETVPAGSMVVMALNAANRDPSMFENPDKFDIRRKPNRHIAFAAGPHFCLGNQFARLEATTMFRAIVSRLPRLRLDGEPRFKSTFVRALDSLTVAVAE
jgi:cytochrome P450